MKKKPLFKVGDVVRLKSTGPLMTVESLNEGSKPTVESINVAWFDCNDNICRSTFCVTLVETIDS